MQLYMPNYDLGVIGKNLRRLRLEKEYSVEYVREYLHLGSVQSIYQYEAGTKYPKADSLLALMELYGATTHDIVAKREEDEKSSSAFTDILLFMSW